MMEIQIYTTPTCPWCKKLKQWLKRRRYSFQELDTTESDTYRDELLEKSGQLAVPVIDISGIIVVGFNEAEIVKAIKRAREKEREEEREKEREKENEQNLKQDSG